jgi:hypothetical protein
VSERPPDGLLPSIALLLKDVGALSRSPPIDTETLARQPVFVSDRWKETIAEFLRWSGTTLSPAGDESVYELILCHGRVGAIAVYRAFRDYLIGRGGALEAAQAKLEAVRIIPSMAAHWLRLTDWDIDDAERLEPADFRDRRQSVVRLTPDLSDRVKKIAATNPEIASPNDLVERAVEEKVEELESEDGGSRGRGGRDSGGFFTMGRTIHDLWESGEKESERPPEPPRKPRREV